MAHFIKKTILFLILNATLLFILVALVIYLNKTFPGDCPSIENVETIILGDSHIMWSLDDSQFNGVRNLSLNAEGYIYTYAKLKYLLSKKNRIRKLYLGFSYHNLSSYYDDYLFGYKSLYFFYRYLGLLEFGDYKTLVMENPTNMIVMPPVILRHGIKNILSKECTFLGTFPKEKMQQTFQDDQAKERIIEQYYSDGEIDSFSELNIQFLGKIIDLCRENNIDIIALNTPLPDKYKKQIPDKFVREYNNYLKRYNLKLFDFKGLRLPDSFYLPDGDHVNYDGAMAATSYFQEYLEGESEN